MDIAKKIKIGEWLTFIYLCLFPFGQIIRINVNYHGIAIPFHPSDLIIFSCFILVVSGGFTFPELFLSIRNLIIIFIFSFLMSFGFFRYSELLIGVLYLFRFIAYCGFIVMIYNIAKTSKKIRGIFIDSLIVISLMVSIFGWIQYFLYPDMRAFLALGWDEHLFRLVGTFMDPTFTGMIILFGLLFALNKLIKTKNIKLLPLVILMVVTIAFTYSRAVYLALLAGVGFLALKEKKIWLILIGILLSLTIIILPRPAGEGVRLERTFSINARFSNYVETMAIIKKMPLFGVGFNNLCLARLAYLGDKNTESHACSGSDSSILYILATSGVIGLMMFVNILLKLNKIIKTNEYGNVFMALLISLLCHSLFSNSLFYPWVMGFMAIFLGVVLSVNKTRK